MSVGFGKLARTMEAEKISVESYLLKLITVYSNSTAKIMKEQNNPLIGTGVRINVSKPVWKKRFCQNLMS